MRVIATVADQLPIMVGFNLDKMDVLDQIP